MKDLIPVATWGGINSNRVIRAFHDMRIEVAMLFYLLFKNPDLVKHFLEVYWTSLKLNLDERIAIPLALETFSPLGMLLQGSLSDLRAALGPSPDAGDSREVAIGKREAQIGVLKGVLPEGMELDRFSVLFWNFDFYLGRRLFDVRRDASWKLRWERIGLHANRDFYKATLFEKRATTFLDEKLFKVYLALEHWDINGEIPLLVQKRDLFQSVIDGWVSLF